MTSYVNMTVDMTVNIISALLLPDRGHQRWYTKQQYGSVSVIKALLFRKSARWKSGASASFFFKISVFAEFPEYIGSGWSCRLLDRFSRTTLDSTFCWNPLYRNFRRAPPAIESGSLGKRIAFCITWWKKPLVRSLLRGYETNLITK